MSGDVSGGVDGAFGVERREVGAAETVAAQRRWWDAEAVGYRAEHGSFLGDARVGSDLVWGPEGLREEDAGLLGDVAGRRVLEVGAGAAQCSRWLAGRGALAVASDLSAGMLAQAVAADAEAGVRTPLVQCDARVLPFADGVFDVVFTSYGALPFVADAERVLGEVGRVLRPGGRFVGSVPHPVRWALPDVPGAEGLRVHHSYFDRRPYVESETDGAGRVRVTYVEHHRTVGDWVRSVRGAGLVVEDLVEPEWSAGEAVWGGWSRLRGELVPGTLVLVCSRPPVGAGGN
ncbi:class I SAM-dependent methyltransferase [Paenibacillus sp. TRM 82003]|uniref:class I SAM-dependent methyltransferase n=1 Tax=Kineococcus sp. TRM81007 TaxID=2925831 RepID=UPI001F57EBFB|nr:class I SAM-dependent methyltransferase [Kineococcus sp. TRM81007]MCI2239093.1 class I SAM-dependent methyltransferase [Kineococcus sp. TRM81007]MCI3924512.1 class I SAM-dependent methyltransferase [Paenibacillus sp. TRM 82003]